MLKPEFRFSLSVLRYSTLYIGIGSHAVAMFAHKKNYGRAGYVDDPVPNIVYMAIWMPGLHIACYGSTTHPDPAQLCDGYVDVPLPSFRHYGRAGYVDDPVPSFRHCTWNPVL